MVRRPSSLRGAWRGESLALSGNEMPRNYSPALSKAMRNRGIIEPLASRSGPLVSSFAQQRLWFLAQMGGVGSAYHMPLAVDLRGLLDRGVLVRALDALVARHEALRTCFVDVG